MNFLTTIAQVTTAATTNPTTAPVNVPWYVGLLQNNYLLIGGMVMVMFLFMGKGKRADEKARAEQLKQLKRGDRIQTIGGIQGTVVTVEENRIAVKVDESMNVKMWFARTAIAKVVETASADAK